MADPNPNDLEQNNDDVRKELESFTPQWINIDDEDRNEKNWGYGLNVLNGRLYSTGYSWDIFNVNHIPDPKNPLPGFENIVKSLPLADMVLPPLDIEKDILDDSMILLIGRRRSGKTYLARWIAFNMKHRFPIVLVLTGTRLNNFWGSHLPTAFIHDIEDISTVADALFARQTIINVINKGLDDNNKIDPRVLLILDDVLQDKEKLRHNKPLSKIFTDGRHYDICVMVTLQDPRGLPPTLRENTDICILFRIYEGSRKEAAIKEWLSSFTFRKHSEIDSFLWNQTGLIDTRTGLKTEKSYSPDEEEHEFLVPRALVVINGLYTSNIFRMFKTLSAPRVNGTDVENFILGDVEQLTHLVDNENFPWTA